MLLLGFALAAVMGLSLGLLGGGGSILTVPIFVYVLGFEPKMSIAMSLPVVGITSLAGAVSHWRAGNVALRTAALFGAVAMVGAYAGARLAVFLTGAAQLAILALVMLVAAARMFRAAARDAARSARPDAAARPEMDGDAVGMSPGLLVPVALGVGVLTGIVGIGGGFLVVPALVVLARTPMKQAVGTSLLVIAMNALSGFAGYVGRVDVRWGFMAAFSAIAIVGILAGSHLVRFVAQHTLKRAFAIFLVVMSIFILYQNRGVLRATAAERAAPPVAAH